MRGDRPGGPIQWRMHLAVPPSLVFAALNSNEGRAAFWAESAVEANGYIQFRFISGLTHVAQITGRRAPRLFSLNYFGGETRFEMTGDGAGGTDLLLIQEGIEGESWHEVHAGWLNVLFPLKAWLEHGVDLRNHDPARTWDHGYADQ